MTSINYKTGNVFNPVVPPPPSLADAAYTGTAPVITNTQSANPTIVSAQKWTPDPIALSGGDRRCTFTYLGAGDYTNGVGVPDQNFNLPLSRFPNTYASGQSNHAVEFMYYGQIFEFKYKYISSATQYRLYINDRKVTDTTQAMPGPPSAGTSNVLKVDLGSVDTWKIRFELATCPFGGIYTGPNDMVWPTLRPDLRVAGFGDSLTDGSAQNTGAGQGTWLKRFGRLIGTADTWDQARGSTGYISPGTTTTLPLRAQRDLVPYSPDVVIMWAGYNDQSASADVQASIRSAFLTTVKTIQAGLPNTDIVVGGVWDPTGNPGAASTGTNTVLRQAAFDADLAFVDMQSGKVYDRYAQVVHDNGAPWITTATVTTFIGADAVHPNNAGHQYLAHQWANAFRALYQ